MIQNSPDKGVITITVPGEPRPQKRAKARAFFNPKTGRYQAQVYDPKGDTADYRARVSHEAAIAMRGTQPLEGPLAMNLVFVTPKPKGKPKYRRWVDVRPDWDNFAKAALDAMQAIVFRDDAQVCRVYVEKRYPDDSESPHTGIMCWKIEEKV